MTTGFFRALRGTCGGTAIFTELQTQSLWRTVWHLLLIAVLAAAVMSVGVCSRLAGIGRAAAEQLQAQCGGLKLSARGLDPLDSPEKPRDFLMPGLFRVNYLPAPAGGAAPSLPKSFPEGSVRGVVWMPDRIGVWGRTGNNTYLLSVVTAQTARIGEVREVGTPDELLSELLRSPALPWDQLGEETQIFTAPRLLAVWKVLLMIGLPVALLFETLFQVLLYVMMFAVVFWVMSLRRPNRRPLREVIVLAVYAGFPAMLIGALAVALDLPYLEFNWIYVLGMTGYLMVVMNRLERDRRNPASDV